MISVVVKTISYLLAVSMSMIGVWLNDFRIEQRSDEIYPAIYEGDFYRDVPYDTYLDREAGIPEGVIYDVRDYGAVPNDDTVLNNKAVNAAIADCSNNGGGIVLVEGGRYRTGSIAMLSNVTLKIAADSALVASHNAADMNLGCVIYANGCQNIKITGPGRVCGEGNYYSLKPLNKPLLKPLEYSDTVIMRYEYMSRVRFPHASKYGGIASIYNSANVTVENIVFENSAHWTLKVENCKDVLVNRFIIDNNRHIGNADGIDILYSSNVEIAKAFISTADDGIVLKNWSADKAVENVHVHDCEVISCTNAFKIGTETRGKISGILVENCKFYMTDIYPGTVSGIAIESMDGSQLTNVTVRNIDMDRVTCPLFIRLGNRNRYDDGASDFSGTIDGVLIENIKADNIELPVLITGVKNNEKGTNYVRNITLKDFTLTYTVDSKEAPFYLPLTPEYEKEYPECWRFMNLPAYGIWARHVDGISIENFTVQSPEKTNRLKYIFCDVLNKSKDS